MYVVFVLYEGGMRLLLFLLLGFRMRQRHVLMESTGPAGHCPHLVESVPCEDPVCYQWLVSEGICIPDHGKCGLGHRILKAVCQDTQGMTAATPEGLNALGHNSIAYVLTGQFPTHDCVKSKETPLWCSQPWLTMGPISCSMGKHLLQCSDPGDCSGVLNFPKTNRK